MAAGDRSPVTTSHASTRAHAAATEYRSAKSASRSCRRNFWRPADTRSLKSPARAAPCSSTRRCERAAGRRRCASRTADDAAVTSKAKARPTVLTAFALAPSAGRCIETATLIFTSGRWRTVALRSQKISTPRRTRFVSTDGSSWAAHRRPPQRPRAERSRAPTGGAVLTLQNRTPTPADATQPPRQSVSPRA